MKSAGNSIKNVKYNFWRCCEFKHPIANHSMYLKIEKELKLVKLGKMLLPGSTEESLEWDAENVYEWIYVNLPGYSFSLNIFREHGILDVPEEIVDECDGDEECLDMASTPGPIYILGWDRKKDDYVYDLPESLIQEICSKIKADVIVYDGRIDADSSDPEPIQVYRADEHC